MPGLTEFQLVSPPFTRCPPRASLTARAWQVVGTQPHAKHLNKRSDGARVPICCLLGCVSAERPRLSAGNYYQGALVQWAGPGLPGQEPRPKAFPITRHQTPRVTRQEGSYTTSSPYFLSCCWRILEQWKQGGPRGCLVRGCWWGKLQGTP